MKTVYIKTKHQSDQRSTVQCVASAVWGDTILVLLMLAPLIL